MRASTNSVDRCVMFAGTRGARRYGERRAMVTGISDRLPALRLTEANCVVALPGPEMTVWRPVRPVPGPRRPDRSRSSGRGRTDSGSARYAGRASRNRGDSRSARYAGRARHRCGVGGAWCDDRHAGRRPGRDGDGCRTRRARHGWRRPVHAEIPLGIGVPDGLPLRDGSRQRRLEQVLGGVAVPGQQVRDPHQRRCPAADELGQPSAFVLVHPPPPFRCHPYRRPRSSSLSAIRGVFRSGSVGRDGYRPATN